MMMTWHACWQAGLGASLLSAAGLGSLVARSWGAYEDLAVALAADPARLASLREQLARGRGRGLTRGGGGGGGRGAVLPVFDARRWARHLEAGLRAAWRRRAVGRPAAVIDVREEEEEGVFEEA